MLVVCRRGVEKGALNLRVWLVAWVGLMRSRWGFRGVCGLGISRVVLARRGWIDLIGLLCLGFWGRSWLKKVV